MSDDREEVDGLPTVAVRTRFPNAESTRWRYHDNPKHGIRVDTIEREKLVRRQDVEQLIKGIFEDSLEPNLKGEAKELRAGGDPADTADMLEYFAEHFKEELLEEVQNQ